MAERVATCQFRLPDGSVTPFDADIVCRALFEFTESAGQPDAFLARELTDGIVFFLSEEVGESIPTAAEILELITKCVRELGHPVLARRMAQQPHCIVGASAPTASTNTVEGEFVGGEPGSRIGVSETRAISPGQVFPRDVVSLQRDGLLRLTGLSDPLCLAGAVFGPQVPAMSLESAIASTRRQASGFIAVDRPERGLALMPGNPAELAKDFVRELGDALQHSGLRGIMNLNQRDSLRSNGGLFADLQPAAESSRIGQISLALARELLSIEGPIELAWHLRGADLQPDDLWQLADVLKLAYGKSGQTFVFDRPRYPDTLGPGLTRKHPVLLDAVGVQIDRLAEQFSAAPERFLSKIGSLIRLARSAGHARYDFLRKNASPELTRGFLVDRARLVVVPIGLEAAVRRITGRPLSDGDLGSEFAKRIVETMRHALVLEPPRNMECCIDQMPPLEKSTSATELTPADVDSPLRQQIKATGALHAIAGAGTAVIPAPSTPADAPEDIVSLLRQAWRQTEVHRITFAGKVAPQH